MFFRLLIILLICLFTSLSAQNSRVSGTISGQVNDKESGLPLEGANVYLEGYALGSSTDEDGYFIILNIPAGNYNLYINFIGYKSYKVENVEILPDVNSTFQILLINELMEGEVVIVTADRPMIRRDITASVKEISALEIKRSPVSNFSQIIAQQIGSVETGRGLRSGGLHIRGGRNNEIAYYVDGVISNDPFSGLSGVNVDNNSIAQLNIITSGFNAEYGESMSGLVHIITKQPDLHNYKLSFEANSDALFSGGRYDWGYNKYFASLTGPVPGLAAIKGSFYSALTVLGQDDRLPSIIRQEHNDISRTSAMLKLSFAPISAVRMQVIGQLNDTRERSYSHSRFGSSYWLNQGTEQETPLSSISLSISHTLSSKTWYDLTVVRFENSNRFSSQNGRSYKNWRTLNSRLDWVNAAYLNGWYDPLTNQFSDVSEEEAFYYYYNSRGNVTQNNNGEWVWNSLEEQKNAMNERNYDTGHWDIVDGAVHYNAFSLKNYSQYLADKDNPATADYKYQGDIDIFYGGVSDPLGNFRLDFTPWWHDHTNSYLQGELIFSSQINKNNFIKAGAKIKHYDLRYKDIQFLNANPYFDAYEVAPLEAAMFMQNKYTYEDLVLNAGLRFDYWDPDYDHLSNLEDLSSPRENTQPKWDLSPRMGISFAASEDMYLFMNYGKFFQKADLSDLYQNLNVDVTNGLPLIGNPDLPAQKTTAYEIGFQNQLSPDVSLKLSAFYKDAENLLSTDKVNSLLDGRPVSYTIYLVNDFAKIKGFELELEKRFVPGISGKLTYSYLDAKGTGSSASDFYYDYLDTDTPLPKKEYPLDYDITHTIKSSFNYYIAPGQGMDLFGIKPFSDINLNIFAAWNTGAAYTPQDNRGNPQERGSGRQPSIFNVDMRVEKYFNLEFSGLSLSLFLDMRNLFDKRNIVQIYNFTGKADDNGFAPVFDPANLGIYGQYESYGYMSAEDMYKADRAGWKKRVKNPAFYTNPRIIRAGLSVSF